MQASRQSYTQEIAFLSLASLDCSMVTWSILLLPRVQLLKEVETRQAETKKRAEIKSRIGAASPERDAVDAREANTLLIAFIMEELEKEHDFL